MQELDVKTISKMKRELFLTWHFDRVLWLCSGFGFGLLKWLSEGKTTAGQQGISNTFNLKDDV